MTTQLPTEAQALQELFGQIAAYDYRADVGYAVGIIPRLSRYLLGDPVKYFSVSSPNFSTPTVLPDDPRAKSAVIQVIGERCTYRLDGTTPALANEQILQIGTVVTLTGMPTIKGFVFQSVSLNTSVLAVTYFD